MPMTITLTCRQGVIELQKIPRGYSMNCPACGVRRALRSPSHVITVANGRVSVSAAIACPTRNCGWHARITAGQINEIADETTGEAVIRLRLYVTAVA
jgi:hypothetical protein